MELFYRLESNFFILIENILLNCFNRFESDSLFIDSYSFVTTEPLYELRIPSITYNLISDGGTFGSAIFAIKKMEAISCL